METFDNFEFQVILPEMSVWRRRLAAFLLEEGLDLEPDIDYSVAALTADGRIAATGSRVGKILKCIAVREAFKGSGLAGKIVSLLLVQAYGAGFDHLFIYTSVANERIFSKLGFYKIAGYEQEVILLENNRRGLADYLQGLARYRKEGMNIGCIVINGNPFTLGHRYLMEYAAKRCDWLHVMVVSEDKSVFPAPIRHELVRRGVADLRNVILHESGEYVISAATFPSYFIKDKGRVSQIHARLDLELFGKAIAPMLGINKRFIGTEPLCPTTATYNRVMRDILPRYGIEVEEVPRLTVGGEMISASRVRQLIGEGKLEALKSYLPPSTYDFLSSAEGENIVCQLQTKPI